MRKSYKYRLYPNAAQRRVLNAVLESCRRVYNKTLEWRETAYASGVSIGLYESNLWLRCWKRADPTLAEVHSQVLQNVQERVHLAFEAFFHRVKTGDEPGYPRFKGKGWYDSFTFKQSGFTLAGDRLCLSKIGSLKIKLHRPVAGTIRTLTVRRDRLGNWYACFSCEVEPEPLPVSDQRVGIDLGLTTFATLSNGETIERQRWMARDARDIARLQRQKEQYAKGSPERCKALRALNHAYQRVTNQRANFAHQASRRLVNGYGLIVFEDLDIQPMRQNGSRTLHRGIDDVAWGQFVCFTAYKAESAGRDVIRIDPRGTTQECSRCSAIVPKDLSVRLHLCPHCGLTLGRDLNAARNILARGLTSLRHRAVEAPSFSCGE